MKILTIGRRGFIGMTVALAAVTCLMLAAGAILDSPAYSCTASDECHDNLKMIAVAKEQWAMNNKKGGEDTPTWTDLKDYINTSVYSIPLVCPSGGTYTIGNMNTDPTCSVGDSKGCTAGDECLHNLKNIAAAKEQWAMDNNKHQEDTPTWADLKGPHLYIFSEDSDPYVCPSGGTYTIGNMATDPTCSVGNSEEPAHVLP